MDPDFHDVVSEDQLLWSGSSADLGFEPSPILTAGTPAPARIFRLCPGKLPQILLVTYFIILTSCHSLLNSCLLEPLPSPPLHRWQNNEPQLFLTFTQTGATPSYDCGAHKIQ